MTIPTIIKDESPTEQLERWIAAQNGNVRDALNVALARLEYREQEVEDLKAQLDDVYGTS